MACWIVVKSPLPSFATITAPSGTGADAKAATAPAKRKHVKMTRRRNPIICNLFGKCYLGLAGIGTNVSSSSSTILTDAPREDFQTSSYTCFGTSEMNWSYE